MHEFGVLASYLLVLEKGRMDAVIPVYTLHNQNLTQRICPRSGRYTTQLMPNRGGAIEHTVYQPPAETASKLAESKMRHQFNSLSSGLTSSLLLGVLLWMSPKLLNFVRRSAMFAFTNACIIDQYLEELFNRL